MVVWALKQKMVLILNRERLADMTDPIFPSKFLCTLTKAASVPHATHGSHI